MKIPFSEIPDHGIRIEVTDTSWLAEEQLAVAGPVKAELVLTRKGENKIELRGRLEAEFELDCDRCLSAYGYSLAAPIQLLIESADSAGRWNIQDLERSKEGLELLQVEEPLADIGEILRQQVHLALPVKKLCRENCRGICPKCGRNRNEEECSCREIPVDSPFQVLAGLKKKNDER